LGALQLALFEATAEQQLIQPTFIVDYPAEVSPLARRNDRIATSPTASSSTSPGARSRTASPS